MLAGFVCVWPLLMFGGSVLTAAMAVTCDRSRWDWRTTALASPSGDIIAAAHILPWPLPFVAGVLATVPLYVLGGSWSLISAQGVVLTPLVFLPTRLLSMLELHDLMPEVSPGGVLCGGFMAATDAALVWAGAHWGAGFAVRMGHLLGVMCLMLWRMFYLSAIFLAWVLPSFACFLVFVHTTSPGSADGSLIVGVQVAYLSLLFWFFTARGAVRAALREFANFHRLAADPDGVG